jgi:hypothetical protein
MRRSLVRPRQSLVYVSANNRFCRFASGKTSSRERALSEATRLATGLMCKMP